MGITKCIDWDKIKTLSTKGVDLILDKKLADTVFQNVWPLIETRKVKPVIYKTYSFQDVAEAPSMFGRRQ